MNNIVFIKDCGGSSDISVKVSTGSREFRIIGITWAQDALRIRCSEPPVDNAANEEIERNLSEFFEADVKITSGRKSGKKTVHVHLPYNKVAKKLSLFLPGGKNGKNSNGN